MGHTTSVVRHCWTSRPLPQFPAPPQRTWRWWAKRTSLAPSSSTGSLPPRPTARSPVSLRASGLLPWGFQALGVKTGHQMTVNAWKKWAHNMWCCFRHPQATSSTTARTWTPRSTTGWSSPLSETDWPTRSRSWPWTPPTTSRSRPATQRAWAPCRRPCTSAPRRVSVRSASQPPALMCWRQLGTSMSCYAMLCYAMWCYAMVCYATQDKCLSVDIYNLWGACCLLTLISFSSPAFWHLAVSLAPSTFCILDGSGSFPRNISWNSHPIYSHSK